MRLKRSFGVVSASLLLALGCAGAQPISLELEPSPGDRSIAIVDASELQKAHGDDLKSVKIVNEGPGTVEVGVFAEPVAKRVDHDQAAQKRTIPAGSEESFTFPGFGSLVIVNRSDGKVTVRVE